MMELDLRDTNMTNQAAQYLCDMLAMNHTLQKVPIDLNQISVNLQTEIKKACQRNRELRKQSRLPEYKRELRQLHEVAMEDGHDANMLE